MRVLATILALILAVPTPGRADEQAEMEALLSLRKAHRLNAAAGKAGEAATIDLQAPLTWTEAQRVAREQHKVVMVRVGHLQCGSLCVSLRPEIPTAHVETLLGDTSPRIELIAADQDGQIWESSLKWRSLPTEAEVRDSAKVLKAWLGDRDRPKPAPTSSLPVHRHQCVCGESWEHTDASFGSIPDHTCPNCGRLVWQVAARR